VELAEKVYVIIALHPDAGSIIPVKLYAYDIDGHEGIYVPNMAMKKKSNWCPDGYGWIL